MFAEMWDEELGDEGVRDVRLGGKCRNEAVTAHRTEEKSGDKVMIEGGHHCNRGP